MITIKIHTIISFCLVLSLPIYCEVFKTALYWVLEVSRPSSDAACPKEVVLFLSKYFLQNARISEIGRCTHTMGNHIKLTMTVYEFFELSDEEVRTDNSLQMSILVDLRVVHVPVKARNIPSPPWLVSKADWLFHWRSGLGVS